MTTESRKPRLQYLFKGIRDLEQISTITKSSYSCLIKVCIFMTYELRVRFMTAVVCLTSALFETAIVGARAANVRQARDELNLICTWVEKP